MHSNLAGAKSEAAYQKLRAMLREVQERGRQGLPMPKEAAEYAEQLDMPGNPSSITRGYQKALEQFKSMQARMRL